MLPVLISGCAVVIHQATHACLTPCLYTWHIKGFPYWEGHGGWKVNERWAGLEVKDCSSQAGGDETLMEADEEGKEGRYRGET